MAYTFAIFYSLIQAVSNSYLFNNTNPLIFKFPPFIILIFLCSLLQALTHIIIFKYFKNLIYFNS